MSANAVRKASGATRGMSPVARGLPCITKPGSAAAADTWRVRSEAVGPGAAVLSGSRLKTTSPSPRNAASTLGHCARTVIGAADAWAPPATTTVSGLRACGAAGQEASTP